MKSTVLGLIFFLLFANAATAASIVVPAINRDVSLEWGHSESSGLVGYIIYFKNKATGEENWLRTHHCTFEVLPGEWFEPGQTYIFTVSGFRGSGQEGPRSAPFYWTAPSLAVAPGEDNVPTTLHFHLAPPLKVIASELPPAIVGEQTGE